MRSLLLRGRNGANCGMAIAAHGLRAVRQRLAAILPAMTRTSDQPSLTARSTATGRGAVRAVQMVLGAALVGVGVWVLGVKLMEILFFAPARIFAALFLGGASATSAGQHFDQAVFEAVAVLVFMAYGAVLFLCGGMNWRVVKVSLWFFGVVAVLAALAALTVWKAVDLAGI